MSGCDVVRLCGTGNIPTISLHKGVVKVLSGASVTVTNFNIDNVAGNELIIYQGGSLTVTNWFNPHHTVVNHGNLNLAALHLSPRTTINNYGSLHLNADNLALIKGNLVNHGSLLSAASINVKHGGQLLNYCSMTLHNNLVLEGILANYSYLKVDDKLTVGGAGEMLFHDGAMTHTGSTLVNGRMEGIGSTSMFKIEGRSDAYSTAHMKGNLFVCDLDGAENLSGSIFSSGAKLECSLYIPTSACNPEGNGIITIVDTDNDGVADEMDAYPNDPAKAGDSYYPAENQYGTLAYEDLWPAYGDYDFNDLVVDYRYHQVLNATNDVVTFNMNVVTRAIGGGAKNGFALELDLAPANVASVSGTRYYENIISNAANGTESGQAKTNIIIYDNASELFENTTGFAFVNTVSSEAKLDYDTALISINFSQPQDPSNLGTAPYNPYIFVDQTRGREVHLPGQAPSSLANANLFGSGDDNTNPADANSTYKSNTNLPWALHLVSGFDYPEEETDISEAYNYFSVWAQSGGASYETWYDDLPGYIDGSDLYSGQ